MSGGGGRVLFVVVIAVVVAAVVAGFLALGTPQDERERRLDQVRVADLEALRSAIVAHCRREGALPDSLEQLARRSPLPVRMTDPVGGRLYGYGVIDSTTYRLCAVFDFPTPEEGDARFASRSWAHGAGRQCFRLRVTRPASGTSAEAGEMLNDPVLEGAPDSVP